jgi:monofunctional biosynthetic peptidoglycan transglycosylase
MPGALSTALRGFGWLLLLGAAVCLGSIGAMRWVDPPTSAFMLRHQWLSDAELHHRWVDWERISPWMRLAVVASEDQRFPMHNGFDVQAIAEALEDHAEGEPLRGASTLSQQVAKNLFLTPSRSFVRKGIEAVLTVLIEALWPKQRILEVYLNIAQFGPNTFGVGAASERFFGIDAADLDRWQAAALAAVLPNPDELSAADPSRYVRQRQDWIVRQMQRLGGRSYLDSITGG